MIKPGGENNVPSGKVAGEQFQGHRRASTRRSNGAPPPGCGNTLMPLAVAIKEQVMIGNNTIPTILLESSRALFLSRDSCSPLKCYGNIDLWAHTL